MRIKTMYLILLPLIIGISLSGCASIMGNGKQSRVIIQSNPENAKVKITNSNNRLVYEGVTPAYVSLKKSAGFFSGENYTINFYKKGCSSYMADDGMKVNGWSWYVEGNLIVGGLIGWFIVDPLTGAMWNINHKHIFANLNCNSITNP